MSPDARLPIADRVDAARIARWLESVEAAIDNPSECTDILCDLAASLEAALDGARAELAS